MEDDQTVWRLYVQLYSIHYTKNQNMPENQLVCRYRILGMQIWISSKHPTFKYDFCENAQYSNMNFCGFLFTPGSPRTTPPPMY